MAGRKSEILMTQSLIGRWSRGSAVVEVWYDPAMCGITISEDIRNKQVVLVFGGTRLRRFTILDFLTSQFIPVMNEFNSIVDDKVDYGRPYAYVAISDLGEMVETISAAVVAAMTVE